MGFGRVDAWDDWNLLYLLTAVCLRNSDSGIDAIGSVGNFHLFAR